MDREKITERIRSLLVFLYGVDVGEQTWQRLKEKMERFKREHPDLANQAPAVFDEQDALLMTYPDQFQRPGEAPLQTLDEFCENNLKGVFSGIHVLPFFPFSSDDGFSVIDYRQVDPDLGEWKDLTRLNRDFRLIVDGVINHASAESTWFQAFLRDEAPYRDYFLTGDPADDLSQVARPRTSPLLTPVETARGKRFVWTTFSADQVDLNYANPDVLLEMIDVLLFYTAQGAAILRLDAIAYLWKEIGTRCIHLPQTHAVVKLIRAVLDEAAPNVLLLTETNVPYAENISYFGEVDPQTGRTDEAQLIYQFPLAPLALHSLMTGDARKLADWVDGLDMPGPAVNFIASHDGIGVQPAKGLLTPDEIEALVTRTKEHGGLVSYKTNPDGSQSAYELNITLYDFLNDPARQNPKLDQARFMAAEAVLLSLKGIPGVYIHSLFGSHNCLACYEQTGRARSINREKFYLAALESEMNDMSSPAGQIFTRTIRWMKKRRRKAFHPRGDQRVLRVGMAVFGLERRSPDGDDRVLCLVNLSGEEQEVRFEAEGGSWVDLLGGNSYPEGIGKVVLGAYQAVWLVEG